MIFKIDCHDCNVQFEYEAPMGVGIIHIKCPYCHEHTANYQTDGETMEVFHKEETK